VSISECSVKAPHPRIISIGISRLVLAFYKTPEDAAVLIKV